LIGNAFHLGLALGSPQVLKPSFNFMKKRILLVDGEVGTRESLLRALMSENYQVLSASNAREALELADESLVDLVLLNLQMLVQNGWDLFERLIHENPLLPVLIITPQLVRPGSTAKTGGGKGTKPAPNLLQTINDLLSEPAQVCLARMAQKLAGTRPAQEERMFSLQPT
jgi:CheY-like chemotaxis protein